MQRGDYPERFYNAEIHTRTNNRLYEIEKLRSEKNVFAEQSSQKKHQTRKDHWWMTDAVVDSCFDLRLCACGFLFSMGGGIQVGLNVCTRRKKMKELACLGV